MKGLSVNSLRILTALVIAILICATLKAFDGMEEAAAEYSDTPVIISQESR